MKTISVRETKAYWAEVERQVRGGEKFKVLNRGTPAAPVGGILGNHTYKAEFIHQNGYFAHVPELPPEERSEYLSKEISTQTLDLSVSSADMP